MGNESGTWIMYGVDWDDEECIHSVEEAIDYIEKVGFLPLFKNDVPGFSLEERTVPQYWWSDNPKLDPWMWREQIARDGRIAYGKFFGKKAGFIAKAWLPYFVNYRRDGYDFDALWDDGKASRRQKKIMDLFGEEHADDILYSYEIKNRAGFGKDGEKNFEGTLTELMMHMYICMADFRKRKNKKGIEYGWNVAMYATLENLFGGDYIASAYSESPKESLERIYAHMREVYPIATERQIAKIIK